MSRVPALGSPPASVTQVGDIFSVTLGRYPPTVPCPSAWRSGLTRMDAARRKEVHEAMVRLSDGDRTAFDLLVDQLWPVIFSFAQRGLGQVADAEDVAQEVFYRICARIADFDRSRDGLSWAFGIASYEIMTHRRRMQRRREVARSVDLTSFVDGSASQEDQVLTRELERALEQVVGELSEEDRESLGLRGDAAVGGATLRKRRQRALERLRGIWRQVYGES
jgi:RNA polymerase sigma-70 factor (ECF subfamily)